MNDLKLDESNVLLYAARFYENPNCFDTIEFYDDLKRISYIKRLFNRYVETGDIKTRLVLNHLIILYNVFGEFATKLLFLKLREYLHLLVPFLQQIGRNPNVVKNIGIESENIIVANINIDQGIEAMLRSSYGEL